MTGTDFQFPFIAGGTPFTLSPASLTPGIIEAGITAKRMALNRHSKGLEDLAPEFREECVQEARKAATAAQATSYLYGCLLRVDPLLRREVPSAEALLALISIDQFTEMLVAIGGKAATGPLAKTTQMASPVAT